MNRNNKLDFQRIQKIITGLIYSEICLLDSKDTTYLFKEVTLIKASHAIAAFIFKQQNTAVTVINTDRDCNIVINMGKKITSSLTLQICIKTEKGYVVERDP